VTAETKTRSEADFLADERTADAAAALREAAGRLADEP